MTKVITFSRTFPAYHPKAGQPTDFVEKFFKSLFVMKTVPPELSTDFNFSVMNDESYKAKHHTIRAANRWKVGDKFSPRVWSSKPYNSKQIIIATDMEVKKIWKFEIKQTPGYGMRFWINGFIIDTETENRLIQNDGLSRGDFMSWFQFPKPFEGQIICWNDKIEY